MSETVLIVETNSTGNGTRAMQHAQARGFRAHFLTRTPEEYRTHDPSPLDVADQVTVVETFDVPQLMRVTAGRRYAAVLAFDELRVVQATLLGELCGAPYNPPLDAVLKVRFKDLARRALQGSPSTVRYAIRSLSEPPKRSPLGYPCVVKPVDEAASAGVVVCRDYEDFRDAVEGLRALVARPNSRGYRLLPTFLVEEYVDGPEWSAELVWSRELRDWRLVGFTAKAVTPEPYRVEVGHVFPHSFGEERDREIVRQLRDTLRVLGLRDTMAHVEFKLHGDRVVLIEVNPRSAGDRITELVECVLGVDLVDLHLAAHLGVADETLRAAEPDGFAGIRFVRPQRAGALERLEVMGEAGDGLVVLRTEPTPVRVKAEDRAYVRLGYAIVHAGSPEEVERRLEEEVRRVRQLYAVRKREVARA
jgi:formate-dependent phosphoribosylglycinamide formyltransferase (GAR transformylase)